MQSDSLKEPCSKFNNPEIRSKADITVGSDCSGLGAEIFGLLGIGVGPRVVHKFASELDEKTRQVYEANHPNVEKMYETCCMKDRRFESPNPCV